MCTEQIFSRSTTELVTLKNSSVILSCRSVFVWLSKKNKEKVKLYSSTVFVDNLLMKLISTLSKYENGCVNTCYNKISVTSYSSSYLLITKCNQIPVVWLWLKFSKRTKFYCMSQYWELMFCHNNEVFFFSFPLDL